MSEPRSDQSYLWDMLEAARNVSEFVSGKHFEGYSADKILRSAVERQIEIIGEAARHLSKEFRTAHSEIPWSAIIAQRHILAHDYGDIRHDRIWRVATVHIPELVRSLELLVVPKI